MNCDPLARWYHALELASVGHALERRRCEFLPQMADARCVLVLGEGDGRFLRRLLAINPLAQVDCVDSSGKMLAVARERVCGSAAAGGADALPPSRVAFHHADARAWTPPEGRVYDLVTTHFFLDCFSDEDAAALIRRYAAKVAPGGRWVLSEFCVPARGWTAWRARVWVGGLYRVFGLVTGLRARRLPEFRAPLREAGFQRVKRVRGQAGMLVSECWIKAVNASSTSEPPPESRQEWREEDEVRQNS